MNKNRMILCAIGILGLLILVGPGEVMGWRTTGGYPVTLDNSNTDCMYPATDIVNSMEFTVWQQWDSTNSYWNIYLRYGNGVTWYPATPYKVTNNGNWSNGDDNLHPDVTASYDENLFCVYIAWHYNDTTSNTYEIETCRLLISSINNTIFATGYGRASDVHGTETNSIYPAIDIGGYYGEVHLVWEDYIAGATQPRIYKDHSINGFTWYTDYLISYQGTNASKDPTITVNHYLYPPLQYTDEVVVLWEQYDPNDTSNPQIHIYAEKIISQTYPAPLNFGPTIVPNSATQNNEEDPDIRFKDTEFCFVWGDDRNQNWEIYYQKVYFNAVMTPTFRSLLRVTSDPDNDRHPMIDLARNFTGQTPQTDIHIVWDTDRNNQLDVYACRGVKNAGGTDVLYCSGQAGVDNRVSFTNDDEDYPDVNANGQYGYCVFEKDANTPWEIKYTMDP